MKFQVLPSREFRSDIRDRTVEIEGFHNYSVLIEGTEITSKDDAPRHLAISFSLDGTLNILVNRVKTKETDTKERLQQKLPGYEFYFETESDKVIRGVLGHYYYFKRRDGGEVIVIVIGASKREYKIILGRLDDPESKLGYVLQNLPDRPFAKADLVHILPYNIVENRQPIKACLDVLEKEEFVRLLKKKGVSKIYVKTNKPIPHVQEQRTIGSD